MQSRNRQFDLWRFIFAVYIVLYHYLGHVIKYKTGGYISVDFFFITSGFFMMQQYVRYVEQGKEPIEYPLYHMKHRIQRLFPIYLFSYIVKLISNAVTRNLTFIGAAELVYKTFPEMFMLKVGGDMLNGATWFVAAMLIAGLLIAGLLVLNRKVFSRCIALLAAILIYSVILYRLGRVHLTISTILNNYIPDGIFRAFAGMSLGVFAWELRRVLLNKKFSQKVYTAMMISGNAALLLTVFFSIFYYNGICDFWYIALVFFAVLFIGIKETKKRYPPKDLIFWLGSLSYPIYLIHPSIQVLFAYYMRKGNAVLLCVIMLIVVIAAAILSNFLVKKLSKFFFGRSKAPLES